MNLLIRFWDILSTKSGTYGTKNADFVGVFIKNKKTEDIFLSDMPLS